MAARGRHAVVLGASMAGLLAARVLADSYDRVTVVERDELPAPGVMRKGVPQARHAHVLLPRGAQVIDELFPGLLPALVADGVPVTVEPTHFHLTFGGHVMAQGGDPWEQPTYQASRALLEGRLLERVRALPGVEVREGYDVVGLAADAARDRVTGARVRRAGGDGAEELLEADLVVAATGRNGRPGRWLEEMGYEPPAEERLPIDLVYVSCLLDLKPGALGDVRVLLCGPVPERPTGVALFEQEDGAWVMTVSGYAGHHPPTEWTALVEFLRAQVAEEVVDAVQEARRLTDLRTYHYPSNLRRRYDRMQRFPGGLLVVGDAVCSFNPFYGQGMTVAALEALALRTCLEAGTDGLARRFFTRSAGPVGVAWQLAVGADLALPSVTGPRPLPVRAINRYVDRVQAAAGQDAAVARTFLRVTSLLDPPSRLFRPATVARVLVAGRRRTQAPAVAAGAAR